MSEDERDIDIESDVGSHCTQHFICSTRIFAHIFRNKRRKTWPDRTRLANCETKSK